MHGDRRAPGEPAELLDGLRLDLVPVDRKPVAVRDQHDETVVRNSGEHSLDDASCLIHAGNDDYHLRFDGAQCLRRDDPTASRKTVAGVMHGARVQLDDPLQLMNPDRAEALAPERISQSHAARLPVHTPPAQYLNERTIR